MSFVSSNDTPAGCLSKCTQFIGL